MVDAGDNVEYLCDDYLIFTCENICGRLIAKEIIGKKRLRKDKIKEYIKTIDIKTTDGMDSNCICVIPMNNVKFDFSGLKLSVDEIKKII